MTQRVDMIIVKELLTPTFHLYADIQDPRRRRKRSNYTIWQNASIQSIYFACLFFFCFGKGG